MVVSFSSMSPEIDRPFTIRPALAIRTVPLIDLERQAAADVARADVAGDRLGDDPRAFGRGNGVADRHVDVAPIVAPCLVTVRITRARLRARAAFGDLDLHEWKHRARLVGRCAARRLHHFDRRGGSAAARDERCRPEMFDSSISPLAPMLTVRVNRSVWRFTLLAATLARLFRSSVARDVPDDQSDAGRRAPARRPSPPTVRRRA